MSLTLKVDGYDLSAWVNVQKDGGLDPADSAYSEPQFSGTPAFSEGQAFIGDAVSNREWSVPLIIKATTTDQLYQAVRDINSHLFNGAQVEFKMDGVANSTFFDLERGRIDANFEYYIARSGRLRAVLRLWTRPYGHTATTRNLASFIATGPVQFPATGVLGDVDALANLKVIPKQNLSGTGLALYGVSRASNFPGIWGQASLIANLGAATVVGASGAVGSQYQGLYVDKAAATAVSNGITIQLSSGQVQAMQGRQRALVIARNHTRAGNGSGAILHAKEKWSGKLIGTALMPPVASGGNFSVFDLGEYGVDAQPTGGLGFALQEVQFNLVNAGGGTASAIASPGLDVTAVIFLPLDIAAGVLVPNVNIATQGAYYINSYPQTRVTEIGAQGGGEQVDLMAFYRGAPPKLPVTGTSMPSGPAQVVMFMTQNDAVVGNLNYSVELSALERFTFQR